MLLPPVRVLFGIVLFILFATIFFGRLSFSSRFWLSRKLSGGSRRIPAHPGVLRRGAGRRFKKGRAPLCLLVPSYEGHFQHLAVRLEMTAHLGEGSPLPTFVILDDHPSVIAFCSKFPHICALKRVTISSLFNVTGEDTHQTLRHALFPAGDAAGAGYHHVGNCAKTKRSMWQVGGGAPLHPENGVQL